MPFTVAHAAAVLPLSRLAGARLPLAALMIGSMSPDFAYFLPTPTSRLATHDIAGLFTFCWPVALVTWLFFVHFLERPTLALIPERWRERITPSNREFSISTLLQASVAVILGAATHILWDSFTHAGTPMVRAFPVLHNVVGTYHGHRIHLYWVLQHVSSVIGMAVLFVWAVRQLRTSKPNSVATTPPAPAAPLITNTARLGAVALFLAASLGLGIANYLEYADSGLQKRLFHFAIGGMTGCVLAWCLVAALINRELRARRSPASL